jgi:hypothetical protein
MKQRALTFLSTALPILMAAFSGCTKPPDIGYQQAGRNTSLPGPVTDATTIGTMSGVCAPAGVKCHKDTDCCMPPCMGGVVAGATGYCSTGANNGTMVCAPDTVVCEESSDCCDGYCAAMGVCGQLPGNACVPDGVFCGQSSSCCSPCGDGGTEPCNACFNGDNGPACNVSKPPYVSGASGPLCVPLGVFCVPSQHACCAPGTCIENESFETICIVPPQ